MVGILRGYQRYLHANEIRTGHDYMYCPLNMPAKRARITGYAAGVTGVPFIFYWHEVLPDGTLNAEQRETVSLFRPVIQHKCLKQQINNPFVMLRGSYTAQLRRPKVRQAECLC